MKARVFCSCGQHEQRELPTPTGPDVVRLLETSIAASDGGILIDADPLTPGCTAVAVIEVSRLLDSLGVDDRAAVTAYRDQFPHGTVAGVALPAPLRAANLTLTISASAGAGALIVDLYVHTRPGGTFLLSTTGYDVALWSALSDFVLTHGSQAPALLAELLPGTPTAPVSVTHALGVLTAMADALT